MEITDVRVKLINDSGDRLRAVCTITFDEQFVVRDVKVVDGANGLFVAMPSRKLSSSCPRCRQKNHLRAKHCSECGSKLSFQHSGPTDADGRSKLHRDIAHPITAEFRAVIQEKVIAAYEAEYEATGRRDEPDDHEQREEQPEAREPQEDARESREEPQERPEREPEREPEPAPVTDEYSALIADLRGRSDTASSQPRGRERARSESGTRAASGTPSESGTRSDSGGRSESAEKPRRRRRGGGGRSRSRDRDEADRPARDTVAEAPPEGEDSATATAVESRKPEPAVKPEPVRKPEPVVEPEPSFGPGPVDEPKTSFGPPPEDEPSTSFGPPPEDEPAFGPGPVDEPEEKEPVDTVAHKQEAVEPEVSEDECDDSTPFGMGL